MCRGRRGQRECGLAGAAALIIASKDAAEKKGAKPLARIIAYAQHAQDPQWFTTAPAEAIQKVLAKAGLKVGDIDIWEVNEAFAVVAMNVAGWNGTNFGWAWASLAWQSAHS